MLWKIPHRHHPVHLTLTLAVGLALLGACRPESTDEPATPPEGGPPATASFGDNPYCADGTLLCSTLPSDQIELPQGCESFDQQCARDFYSWQTFISLNWPGAVNGTTVAPSTSASIGGAGDRVWELWMDPDAVFLPGGVEPTWTPGAGPPAATCAASTGAKGLLGRSAKAAVSFDELEADSFFEATVNQPLIDQDLNFVVFEIRMNQQEVDWVVSKGLYQRETVDGWTDSQTLDFPADAIEVKAAWRVIPDDMPATQKERYYRRQATIVLDPSHVQGATGSDPVCLVRELGLVGLHVRHNGLWGTFEQVDNVTASTGITPTFNDPSCTDCTANVPPTHPDGTPIEPAEYQWTTTGASASLYEGFPNVPSQITYAPGQTQWIDSAMNTFFQTEVLDGTVWEHYMLITTNWIEFPTSSQPVPSLNTSLEPYIPTDTQVPQACIDCHKLATNANGVDMAMTFLVFRACPTSSGDADDDLPPNCVVTGGTQGFGMLAASH